MKQEEKHRLDDRGNARRIFLALVTLCVLLVLADLLYHKHGHYSWEQWLGFHGFYAFFGSVGVVLIAKLLARILVRGDDYYDR